MRRIPSHTRFGRLAAAALAAALLGAPMSAAAADKVDVQLDYVVRGNHAMFFVAKEKGYFAKQGIEVGEIRKGTGSPNAMRLVGNGNAEFGFGDLPTLAVARSQNVPVVAIAAVNQRSPLAMISLAKSHPLKKPQDLKGLNFGLHAAGSTYIFAKAFLAANGMTEDDIKKSTVSPPFENYLLLGRVDVVAGYVDAEVPELEHKAGGPGSLSILLGADYGYGVYGSGLFTSEKMIAEKADLVQRFVTAYLQAFRDVIDKPEEAADIVVKANPEYAQRKEVLVKQLEADIHSTFFSPETKAHGIGSMTKASWETTAKTLLDQGAMKQAIDVNAAFTDRFVSGANPVKR
jgi:NitT/TauT family transport system substrate-binding protein